MSIFLALSLTGFLLATPGALMSAPGTSAVDGLTSSSNAVVIQGHHPYPAPGTRGFVPTDFGWEYFDMPMMTALEHADADDPGVRAAMVRMICAADASRDVKIRAIQHLDPVRHRLERIRAADALVNAPPPRPFGSNEQLILDAVLPLSDIPERFWPVIENEFNRWAGNRQIRWFQIRNPAGPTRDFFKRLAAKYPGESTQVSRHLEALDRFDAEGKLAAIFRDTSLTPAARVHALSELENGWQHVRTEELFRFYCTYHAEEPQRAILRYLLTDHRKIREKAYAELERRAAGPEVLQALRDFRELGQVWSDDPNPSPDSARTIADWPADLKPTS